MTIISIILLFLLIAFHEFGHYVGARIGGIPVEEVAVGIGKTIWKKKKGNTTYKINIFPMLGYVKIKGMEDNLEATDGYYSKNMMQKFLAVFCGPFFNIILSILIIFIISYFIYIPTTTIVGISPERTASSPFMVGDRITAVNNIKVSIPEEISVMDLGDKAVFTVIRNGETKNLSVNVSYKDNKQVSLGLMLANKKGTLIESIIYSIRLNAFMVKEFIVGLGILLSKQGLQMVSSPIGVINIINRFAINSFYLFRIIAAISIALGLTNLLPLPALDGGWIALIFLDKISRKKISPKRQNELQKTGLIIMMSLLLIISLKDIAQMIGIIPAP